MKRLWRVLVRSRGGPHPGEISIAGTQSQSGCEIGSRIDEGARKCRSSAWRVAERTCQAVCVALRSSAWLCVLGVLGLVPCAVAADVSVPVDLSLSGADDCASLRELLTSIQKRNGRVRLAAGGELATTLTVSLWRSATGLTGELRVLGVDGSHSTRRVVGTTCASVLETLALTASLALQAPLEPQVGSESEPDRVTDLSPGAALESTDRTEAPKSSLPLPAAPKRRLLIEAGAQAALSQVVAPHLNVGGGVLARARWERDELFSPSLSISALHTRNELFESSRHAALHVTGVSVVVCLVSLRPLARLRLEPCWMTTGAELQALGRELDFEQSVSRSWWGTGALARLAFEPTPRFAVELEGGGLLSLVERRFVALPSRTLLGSTPAIVPIATAGVVYAL